jgi:hypothetical protein
MHLSCPGLRAPGRFLSTPPGSNPATLSGSVLSVNGVDREIIVSVYAQWSTIDGCVDSAEFSIFIQDVPTLDLGMDTIMCNDQVLDLLPALGGSALNVDWSASEVGECFQLIRLRRPVILFH